MFTDENNPALQALERFAEEKRAFWKNPPRGRCREDGCCETNAVLYVAADEVERCATHHSRLLNRKHEYPCDNCGQGPAFRDPAHRRDEMLCPRCHAKDGYVPTERAMVNKTAVRMGVTHSRGQKAVCIAAGRGTDCHGQVKQRSNKGVLCDFHSDPVRYVKARQP
jgi:hypothetical protein